MSKPKYDRGSVLNELHAVALILYLDEKKEALATELLNISGNYIRLKSLAGKMEKIGLVNIVIEEEPRVTYRYSLTEKGTKVAEKLKEIEIIIKNSD